MTKFENSISLNGIATLVGGVVAAAAFVFTGQGDNRVMQRDIAYIKMEIAEINKALDKGERWSYEDHELYDRFVVQPLVRDVERLKKGMMGAAEAANGESD